VPNPPRSVSPQLRRQQPRVSGVIASVTRSRHQPDNSNIPNVRAGLVTFCNRPVRIWDIVRLGVSTSHSKTPTANLVIPQADHLQDGLGDGCNALYRPLAHSQLIPSGRLKWISSRRESDARRGAGPTARPTPEHHRYYVRPAISRSRPACTTIAITTRPLTTQELMVAKFYRCCRDYQPRYGYLLRYYPAQSCSCYHPWR